MQTNHNKTIDDQGDSTLKAEGMSDLNPSREQSVDVNKSYTVLIAEDEDINFMILELLFRNVAKMPYSLHRAINGKLAVEFCASHTVDLVLMDIKMPIMDGYEATRLIKASYPDLPIVVQTAYATEIDRRKAFDHGCDEFLTKPIQKEQLAEVLKQFLK